MGVMRTAKIGAELQLPPTFSGGLRGVMPSRVGAGCARGWIGAYCGQFFSAVCRECWQITEVSCCGVLHRMKVTDPVNQSAKPQPSIQPKAFKNNFDILRIVLATTVFYAHMGALAGIDLLKNLPSGIAVQGFFIVSGYLIVKSYLRNSNITTYIKSRFFRIYPLMFVVISFCFIIGYLNYPSSFYDYMNDGALKYLISNYSFANFLAPSLPGMFTENEITAVNGSLWTLKVEVMFYISVPIIYGFFNRYINNHALTILIAVISIASHYLIGYLVEKHGFSSSLHNQIPSMMLFFMVGAMFNFANLEFLKGHHLIFLIPLLFLFKDIYILSALLVGAFVYIIAFSIKPVKVSNKIGDVSYGIYIWHFPIIQIYVMYGFFENIYIGFVLSTITVALMATCSWHFIESKLIHKPFNPKKLILE